MARMSDADVSEIEVADGSSAGGVSAGGKESVSARALDNIMKLLTSQISLEKKSKTMKGEDKEDAGRRMAEIEETLEKLVALAKKRKYISADNTVSSLRQDAERKVQEQAAKSTITKMTQMKQRLDAQSVAVAKFLKDRQDGKDASWEEVEWQKLLRSNQATLVLMQRLSDKGLVTEEMLKMAALPDTPPPTRRIEPDAQAQQPQTSATPPVAPSMPHMQGQMGVANSMAGMPASNLMHGMIPGMNPHMMAGGMPGMMPGIMPGMNGMQSMMPGMMPPGYLRPGAQQLAPPRAFTGDATAAPAWGGSLNMPGADGDSTQSAQKGERKSAARLSTLDESQNEQERSKAKKKSSKQRARERAAAAIAQSDMLKEDKLFNKNKGVGTFNNNFKVADDIRLLGAVPEEEDEREVPEDMDHAHEMEMEHQRNIEEDMSRERGSIIQALMKRAGGGGGGEFSGVPVNADRSQESESMANNVGGLAGHSNISGMSGMTPSAMQMQYMQQQNMMQMMMMMNMRGGAIPGMQGGMPGMGGMPMMGGGGMSQGMGMAGGMQPGMAPGMMNPMQQQHAMQQGMTGSQAPAQAAYMAQQQPGAQV